MELCLFKSRYNYFTIILQSSVGSVGLRVVSPGLDPWLRVSSPHSYCGLFLSRYSASTFLTPQGSSPGGFFCVVTT